MSSEQSVPGRASLVSEALLVFVFLDLGFLLLGFPRVYRLVQRRKRRVRVAESFGQGAVVGQVLRAVEVATRYYWRNRLDCLPRAMATYLLLLRRGVPTKLHIGVKRYPFAAHAWVECRGAVLGEASSKRRHEPYVSIVST